MASFRDPARADPGMRKYLAAMMKLPLLERELEADLARRWGEQGDEGALHEIVLAHARLVVRVAARFRSSGLPLADLIQEGNIGLMEAAARFDPSRGVRFSTYAHWWIVAMIQRFVVSNFSLVPLPNTPNYRRLFFNLRRLKARLSAGLDGQLNSAQRAAIAQELDVTPDEVERADSHFSRREASLNTPVQGDEDSSFLMLLADGRPTPEEQIEFEFDSRVFSNRIRIALRKLSDRERQIILGRFLNERKQTLADLGARYGVSKERISQIERAALKKLRRALEESEDHEPDYCVPWTADDRWTGPTGRIRDVWQGL